MASDDAHRIRFAVEHDDDAVGFELVQVGRSGGLPFLSCLEMHVGIPTRAQTRLRDASRIYSAIRDYAVTVGPDRARAMLTALANADDVFGAVVSPVLEHMDGRRAGS